MLASLRLLIGQLQGSPAWRTVLGVMARSGRRRPRGAAPGVIAACRLAAVGLRATLLVADAALLFLVLWRFRFLQMTGRRLQSSGRRSWVYARRWPAVAAGIGLSRMSEEHCLIPRVGRLSCGRWSESLRVRMLPGQTAADYEQASDR